MWHSHLKQVVEKKTEISELDTILGKKDDDERDNESLGNCFNNHFLFLKLLLIIQLFLNEFDFNILEKFR